MHRRSRKNAWLLAALLCMAAAVIGLLAILWNMRQNQMALESHAARQAQRKAEEYRALALAEKEWILQCQTDSGLLLYREWSDSEEDSQTAIPYFSTIAALGLLSGQVTVEHADAVRHYIVWYLEHLNTAQSDPVNGDGTIYDVRVFRNGTQLRYETLEKYDSVDSYAATFLMLANRYSEKTGDTLLAERKDDVIRVVNALLRMIEKNHLSYVKTGYPVQYLMDNAEVCAGLREASQLLARIAPETQLPDILCAAAQHSAEGIENLLWDARTQTYRVGLQSGKPIPSDDAWNLFYPDSIAQLFPAVFQTADDDRGRGLYDRFCLSWDWEALEHVVKKDTHFYWCILACAAARMNDETRLLQFSGACRAYCLEHGRDYPFYIAEAGWLAMAYGQMEEQWEQLAAPQ